MGFRITDIRFKNRTQNPSGSTLTFNGFVGDVMQLDCNLVWNSVQNFSPDFDVILNPDPTLIGFAPGTNVANYIYLEENELITDLVVGDNLYVNVGGSAIAREILEFGDNFIKLNDATFTQTTLAVGDFIAIAPKFDQLTFDINLASVFSGFNSPQYRFRLLPTQTVISETKPFVSEFIEFTIDPIDAVFDGETFNGLISVQALFIIEPILEEGEIVPNVPQRFTQPNDLNCFLQCQISSSVINNTRIANNLNETINGNTGWISQTLPNGVNILTYNQLSLSKLSDVETPVLNVEQNETYVLQFNLGLPQSTIRPNDVIRLVAIIEDFENDSYSSELFAPDENDLNIFLAENSYLQNGFTFDLFLGPADTNLITGVYPENGVWQIQFTTGNLPVNKSFVLYANIYPNRLLTNAKSVFLGKWGVIGEPQNYGIRLGINENQLHFDAPNVFRSTDERIAPIGNEVLSFQRFWVELPSTTKVLNAKLSLIAKGFNNNSITELESYNVNLSNIPILDGQFQNINFAAPRVYPRAANDLFKNIFIRRNTALDTATERCFEFVYPFIVRDEFWLQFTGSPLPPANFNPELPFNGFNQNWQQYGLPNQIASIGSVLRLTVQKNNIIEVLESEVREGNFIEPYIALSENLNFTFESELGNFVTGFGTTEVTAFIVSDSNEVLNNPASYWGGILWVQQTEIGGVESRYRISSRRPKDPITPWVENNCTITKVGANRLEIKATLNGAFFDNPESLTFGAYLTRDLLPIADGGTLLEVENNILLEVENNVLLQVE